MATVRPKHVIVVLLLFQTAVVGLIGVNLQAAERSASIQATAHVEASLGLAEAEPATLDIVAGIEPRSHLFWLYYPCRAGVTMQLAGVDEPISGLLSRNIDIVAATERQFEFAALVDLAEATRISEGAASPIVITVVFTDN